jgi:hypothetical protein
MNSGRPSTMRNAETSPVSARTAKPASMCGAPSSVSDSEERAGASSPARKAYGSAPKPSTAPAPESPNARDSAPPVTTAISATSPAATAGTIHGGPDSAITTAPIAIATPITPSPNERVVVGRHRSGRSRMPLAMTSATSSNASSGSWATRGRK